LRLPSPLNAAGILVARHRLGRTWPRHLGALLYLVSVIYQGGAAVLLSFPPLGAQDATLRGIAPGYVAYAALLTSAAMLALLAAYLIAQPQCPRPAVIPPARDLARTIDWRVMAAVCLPLAALIYSGRGYNAAIAAGQSAPLTVELSATFFILLVPVAACGLILRYGTRWFLPVLATQSLLLAAAGERTPVLAAAVALPLMLTVAGERPSRHSLHVTAALAVILVLAITGVRATSGRGVFSTDTGLSARADALAAAVTSPGGAVGAQSPGLLAQAATRLDGDSFTAGILQARHLGAPLMSAAAVPESLLVAVPSALWPSKLTGGTALDPFQAQMGGFGLQDINFLPTLPGLYAGFLSWPWLAALMAVFGGVWGRAERWLLADVTPARLVLLAGVIIAVSRYEAGLPAMLVALRAALVTSVVVKVIEVVRGRKRTPAPILAPLR
jgi:hypothetical protein